MPPTGGTAATAAVSSRLQPENPGDPLLSTARSVVPTLQGLDGSARELCRLENIVAIQYEGTISPPFIAFANTELSDIQNGLDELAGLAEDLRRQFVAFVFDNIFCPAVRSVYGYGGQAPQDPGVSIGTEPSDVAGQMKVRYDG